MAIAHWTLNQVLQQLNGGQRWAQDTIRYAFPGHPSGLYSQGEAQGFRPMNPSQQAMAVLALLTWDELIPQNIVPGAQGATEIEFGYTNASIGYAHAYYPQVGSVWFNSTESDLTSPVFGAYGFLTFVHEIGHALGLNHMGDYNGNGNWSPSSYQDSIVLSVMSYFGPRNAASQYSPETAQADWIDEQGRVHEPQTPMVNDVAAIESIYGTSTTTRAEHTTYGFHSNITGGTAQIYDFARNPNPVLTIFDSAGIDTLDLSGWQTPSRIDLRPGAYSNANAMTNNIAIALSTLIENAVGGGGGDVLIGNSVGNRLEGGDGDDEISGLEGDDVLVGGAGNDTLDGGPGDDETVFAFALGSYAVSVSGSQVTLVGGGSTIRTSAVERFAFADGTRSLAELSGGDTRAPTVAATSPVDNAADVAGHDKLVLDFSEAMKAGSGSISVYGAAGNLVLTVAANDASQVRVDGHRVVIDPMQTFAPGSYYVNVAGNALTDLAGNAFAGIGGNQAWNFSVVDVDRSAPRLLGLTPADDAAQVVPSAPLTLVFDENVQRGSGNITLRDASGAVQRTISVADAAQVSINGATVTIDPSGDLAGGVTYSVGIDAGAFRDLAGNAFAGLGSPSAWNFTTAAKSGDDYSGTSATSGVVRPGAAAASGVIEVADDADAFRVELVAGLTYVFTLQRTAGGLSDPLLGLFDAREQLLTQDDDSAGAGNARIVYTAQTSGTHYLLALDYGSGIGAYTLAATIEDQVAPTLTSRTPADNASGVAAGADLVLGFSEAVFPGGGSIRLLNASGALLREIPANDAGQVRIDGDRVIINPSADLLLGSAYVVNVDANAFRDAAGNAFAGISGLTAWNFNTAAPMASDDYPMSVSTPGVVSAGGAALAARIDGPADGDLFRVDLTAGMTYQLEMNAPASSRVDPYLMLYGLLPEVDLIGFDDDGAGDFNARLYFTPAETGTYYMAAYDYADATGGYSVRALVPGDDYLGSSATSGRLSVDGAAVDGRIGVPADVDAFSVSLSAGMQYTFDLVRASSGGLEDPYLVLFGPDGSALTYDDDSGANFNSRITFAPATSGSYTLSVADFDVGTGGYTISAFRRNVIEGSATDDSLGGTAGADTLAAGSGNDTLDGAAGDDLLEGGPGVDVGVYRGGASAFEILRTDAGWVLSDGSGAEGIDNLVDVERLRFGDTWWAIDVEGHAGTTAKILGAVFGAAAVENTEYVGIGLWALDAGMGYGDLLQLALQARLGERPRNGDVVDVLYTNLVGMSPPAADYAYYVGLLDSRQMSQAELVHLAVEHPLNLQNIGFEDMLGYGLPYEFFAG